MNVRRLSISMLNTIAGIALLAYAYNMQGEVLRADWSGACGTEANPSCEPGEACCNGVCFDPMQYACDCDGQLVPVDD